MIQASTDTLLALVESSDADGCIHFLVPLAEPMRNRPQARDWLDSILFDLQLPRLRFDVVKKTITELDLRLQATPAGTQLTLNLAKLLLLPAVSPAAELAEFHAMLVEMKAFFARHVEERADIQLCNERDRNKRVYGSITCRVQTKEGMVSDEAATASLVARIDASSALSHWLLQVGLTLQKIGPWSWLLIREQELFGYGCGPHFQYHLTNALEAQKSRAEPKMRRMVID